MKKICCIIAFFIFNFYFSQTDYVLKLKFNEKYFLSNFITNKTKNEFVLNVFKKTDSITQKQLERNYLNVLDSILKQNIKLAEKEKQSLTNSQKTEFDSLASEIKKGKLLELFKNAVKVNFGPEFLEQILNDFGIKNYKVIHTDYNQFSINFSDKVNLEKVKTIFSKNRLSFHEAIDEVELEKIQNCFMKENNILVKNNYLKKENDYLLIYKDEANLFQDSYKNSKCFDSKKTTFLLKNGEDFDVFSKLFFVKETDDLEKILTNSVKGFDFEGHQDQEIYDGNYFYISLFFDQKGKEALKKFSEKNKGKKVFIGENYEFLMSPNISKRIEDGMLLKGNLFNVNWQKVTELTKFEVFRNSLEIQ